jgi:hypothetical protein
VPYVGIASQSGRRVSVQMHPAAPWFSASTINI